MNAQYVVIVDTDALANIPASNRDWLYRWLRDSSHRSLKNIVTIGCATAMEASRVTTMLARRGMPGGAMLTRGGA